MDQVVVNFDNQLNESTQILNKLKQLTFQREQAIQQKNNQPLLKIEQEMRTIISKIQQQIPKLDTQCQDIFRNTVKYKISKQESEKRVNQFQNMKTQFVQQEKAAFATLRKVDTFQSQQQAGRQNDVEMQDMSNYELSQYRKDLDNKENTLLEETNDALGVLIKKQKQAGNMIEDSNAQLDDINNRADKVNEKMVNVSGKFEDLLRTTSNNTLWIIIVINIFLLVFLISL